MGPGRPARPTAEYRTAPCDTTACTMAKGKADEPNRNATNTITSWKEEQREEKVREQSTGPRREGKATRGQGSTYRYDRAVRVDQLSGRVPLREGLLNIRLQKRGPWEGEEGGAAGRG